jgi:hypothetical protein
VAKIKKNIELEAETLGAFRSEPSLLCNEEPMIISSTGEEKMSIMDDFTNDPNANAGLSDNDEAVDFSDFSDTHEEVVLPDGSEVKLRCMSAAKGEKDGRSWWLLRYEPMDEPYAKSFTVFLNLVNPGDDARQRNQTRLNHDKWAKAHDVYGKALRVSDCVGLEAWAILGSKDKGDEYGPQNFVRRWVSGK